MDNEMTKMLIECFNGKGAHVDALKAIADLTASEARTPPKPGIHGIWANLHHMVFWYDVTLEAIQGKKMDWKERRKKEWPSEKEMEDDRHWEKLTSKFKKDLEN